MPIKYKINVVSALRDAGYSSYRIRMDKILGQSVLTKLRREQGLSFNELEIICRLLNCQPGDLLEYVPEDPDEEE